jgi:hypothetical protein
MTSSWTQVLAVEITGTLESCRGQWRGPRRRRRSRRRFGKFAATLGNPKRKGAQLAAPGQVLRTTWVSPA